MHYKNLVLFLVCLVLRLCCLISTHSYYVADEYWQSLEVAHNLVFGYGHITWEWIHSIRSYLYVSWIALLYQILRIIHCDTVESLILLPCICQGIFSAISDFYFISWVHKVSSRRQQAYWSVWCYMTNVFLAYCATRTLTNTAETNLTNLALYHYPWTKRENGNVKYFWFVCLAFVMRPTAAIQWLPLVFFALADCQHPVKTFFRKYVPIGVLVLFISTLIDCYFSGKLVFTWWNFFTFNIFHNISANYSVQSLYWYFALGLPVVLGPNIVPFYLAIASRMKDNTSHDAVFKKLSHTILFSLAVYSFIPHKEFRFVLPLTPLMIFISSYPISRWTASLKRTHAYLLTFTLLAISLHTFYYLSHYHQVASVKVMQYLRNPDYNLLFLMPCHSTPLYSHLHINISTRFLHCDPDFTNNKRYVEEATKFYKNPSLWLETEYPQNSNVVLPTHIICFNTLVPSIDAFLTSRGYKNWLKIFHGNFLFPRQGNYLLVYRRYNVMISQM